MLKKYCDVCGQPITEDRPDVFDALSVFGKSVSINGNYLIDISVFDRPKERDDHSICPACFINSFMSFYKKELSMNPPKLKEYVKEYEEDANN